MPKFAQTIAVEGKLREVGFQPSDTRIRTSRTRDGYCTSITFYNAQTASQNRFALVARGIQITLSYGYSGELRSVSGYYHEGIDAKVEETFPEDDGLDHRVSPPVRAYPPVECPLSERISWSM